MAAGGFGSFVSQATNSFVNNEFDIGRMFEDLTSSQNLRGLGISMATAGLTQGLLSEIGGTLTDLGLTRQASRSVIQTSVSTGFNVVTQDLDPREALTQMLVNVAVNIGGGMAAEGIGDLRVDNHINGLTPTAAHMVLGALVGAASNLRDPLRGAAGGGIGAGIAHIIAENLPPSLSDDRRLDIGVLAGGVGAFIAGVDTSAAGVAGTIAVERNCLMHAVLETAALAGDEIIAANNALDRAGELMTTDTPYIAESQQAHLAQVDRELEELSVAFENSNLSASDRRFYSEIREELEERRNGILNVPTTPLGYAGLALTVTPWGNARRAVGEGIGVVRGIFSNSAVVQRGAQAVRVATFEGRAAVPVVRTLPKLTREYCRDMERRSGVSIPGKQRSLLKSALQRKKFEKLSPEKYSQHIKIYRQKSTKNKIIADWERNTGQNWPVKKVQVMEEGMLVDRDVPAQIHHIIPQQHGGPHEWWNAHPLFPSQHQGGVHGAGSSLNQIINLGQ